MVWLVYTIFKKTLMLKYKKLGPLITQVLNNNVIIYTSRSLRKSLHKPTTLSWWISILFMMGSFLFILPSFLLLNPQYEFSDINKMYFIGSLFFTSAAYLQYLESINSDITNSAHVNSEKTQWLWFQFRPNNAGYLSSLSQFIGTIFFNFDTFDIVFTPMSIDSQNLFIWTPNILGSVLFLLSSIFAWVEVFHDNYIKAFKAYTWWIIWINILGSVLFLVSALYSFNFESGQCPSFDTITQWTTLYGAVCFFTAAFLMHFEKNILSKRKI